MADGGWRKFNLTCPRSTLGGRPSGKPYLRRSSCDVLSATPFRRRLICDASSATLHLRRFIWDASSGTLHLGRFIWDASPGTLSGPLSHPPGRKRRLCSVADRGGTTVGALSAHACLH